MSETLETLRAQLDHQIETRQLLFDITQHIASSGTLDEMLLTIGGILGRALSADGVVIALGGEKAGSLYAPPDAVSTALGHAANALLRHLDQGGAAEISDVTAIPELGKTLKSVRSLIVLPLTAHEARHGFIALAFISAHAMTESEHILLAIVAGQVAVAVENAQAFESMRHSQEQLAAILASTADPVIVIDAKESIVLLNPAAEKALSVRGSEVSGKRIGDVVSAEPLLELLHDGSKADSVEWQNEAGQTYAPRLSEIKAGKQGRRGSVLILRDITRYKTLHANQTEFVSTVSHDLRSPLTYMQGYASMLPMLGELTPKQKDAAEKIVGGIAQMTDLVDKVLDAGRLDPQTGYYDLMREPCDVLKMANEIITTHTMPAEKKDLKLIAHIDQTMPILNLDEAMLKRALNNLVDNAVKYTPEGGTVTVSAAVKESNLVLSVQDTGLGISQENQQHLFERFRRVRRKEHQRVKGSGLGLFIVLNVAQKHGGHAWVESQEGVGSTFFIRVPLEGANLIGGEAKPERRAD